MFNSVVKAVSYRISKLSANKQIFDNNAGYYNQALAKAGYTERIQFIDIAHNENQLNNSYNNSINHTTVMHPVSVHSA